MTQPLARDSFREEITPLLVERIRAGLKLSLVSISLFAIADLLVYRNLLPPLWLLKATQIATLAATYVLLRRPVSRSKAVAAAAATLAVLCITTAASGVVTHDAATTPALLVVLSMGAATLLPWGVAPQLVTQVVATASAFWNVDAVTGMGGMSSLPLAVLVGSFAALYAAHASERWLLERRRADQAEAEARARRHQAEVAQAARLSTLGGMAAGLAHEINQPLSAIVSYARGSVRRLEVDEITPEALLPVVDEISAQALRAAEVLRRIQTFVRHTQTTRDRVDLNVLVREALHFAEVEAMQLGIVLRLVLWTETLAIEADAIQIEQVILNLVRNGFEAMSSGGSSERELTIETRLGEEGAVELAVCDTGEGISSDIAGQLFDPFFTTRRDGLGLGLAISRTIIEAHGGRLWTTPNPPRGAVFRFAIPHADGAVNAA